MNQLWYTTKYPYHSFFRFLAAGINGLFEGSAAAATIGATVVWVDDSDVTLGSDFIILAGTTSWEYGSCFTSTFTSPAALTLSFPEKINSTKDKVYTLSCQET